MHWFVDNRQVATPFSFVVGHTNCGNAFTTTQPHAYCVMMILMLCYYVAVLQTNNTLMRLDLSWNGFGYDGCVALACMLRSNTSLLELNVESNRIHPPALFELVKGLVQNRTLELLKVCYKHLYRYLAPQMSAGACARPCTARAFSRVSPLLCCLAGSQPNHRPGHRAIPPQYP